jgi:hypothetical protein
MAVLIIVRNNTFYAGTMHVELINVNLGDKIEAIATVRSKT